MAAVLVERAPAPYRGLNTDSSPEQVGTTQALEFENFLPGRYPGRAVLRGPATGYNGREESSMMTPYGCMVNGGAWCVSFRATDGSFLVTGNYEGQSPITFTTDCVPGNRYTVLANTTYGFAATDQDGKRRLLKWDGTSLFAPTAVGTTDTDTPYNGVDVTAYLNRLFVLGAQMDPQSDQNNLMWSDQKSAVISNAITEWQDDVSGLTNRIVLDLQDLDEPVALARIKNGLVILCYKTVWLLSGRTPSSFTLRQVSNNIGCLAADSVVEYNDACYFMTAGGYVRYDGVQFTAADTGVNRQIIDALSRADIFRLSQQTRGGGVADVDKGYCRAMVLPSGYLLLTIGHQPYDTAVNTTYVCLLANLETGTWSSFSAPIMSSDYPILFVPTIYPIAFDGQRAWNLEGITNPPSGQGYDLDTFNVHGTEQAYVPRLRTRPLQLGTPTLRAQVTNALVDYRFVDAGATSDEQANFDGWTLKLEAGDGSTVFTSTLPVQSPTTGYDYRRRAVLEVFEETDDVYVVLTWTPDAAGQRPSIAELHDIWIEYSPSYARSSS